MQLSRRIFQAKLQMEEVGMFYTKQLLYCSKADLCHMENKGKFSTNTLIVGEGGHR